MAFPSASLFNLREDAKDSSDGRVPGTWTNDLSKYLKTRSQKKTPKKKNMKKLIKT
jgi:hypothetical protein